ncbi:hypothetical protein AX15_000417 [Amanita polypyramis BW_CC]|nr:hypothetical protein AX15_000417 [Amanita polypyramis BW_CC]
MANILFHRLLRYDLEWSRRAPIDWDMRDKPTSARYHPLLFSPTTLSLEDLAMPATSPRVVSLPIICDVLPCNSPIVARNFAGVTIHDVLLAVYDALQVEITKEEWNRFTRKQRDHIQVVRGGRLQRPEDPTDTRSADIKGIDILLHHTLFGGLTPIPAAEPACVLTLRRTPR